MFCFGAAAVCLQVLYVTVVLVCQRICVKRTKFYVLRYEVSRFLQSLLVFR